MIAEPQRAFSGFQFAHGGVRSGCPSWVARWTPERIVETAKQVVEADAAANREDPAITFPGVELERVGGATPPLRTS